MLKLISLLFVTTLAFAAEFSVEAENKKTDTEILINSSISLHQREVFSEFQIKTAENTYMQSVRSVNLPQWSKDHKDVKIKKIITKSAYDEINFGSLPVTFIILIYEY